MGSPKLTDGESDFLRESNAIEGVFDEVSFWDAAYAWEYLKEQNELTTSVILKTHKILMLNQKLQPDERGYFRKCEVKIGYRFGMNYILVPSAIADWCEDVKTSIEVPGRNGNNIKVDHIEYEKIHPFVDGNGRTGRMFMNWERLKAGLDLMIIWEADKSDYYKWFK